MSEHGEYADGSAAECPGDGDRASEGGGDPSQYDRFAEIYARRNEMSAYNAYYERPATIELLGPVDGLKVLDAGCGAGHLTAWLVDNGAEVTGIDASAAMLRLARARLGDRATFHEHNIDQPLTFLRDGSFDRIVASLVLHYVRDWEPVLRECRRLLAPDGAMVFSTHHPAMDWQAHSPDDYFAVKYVTERWAIGAEAFDVSFWRRPLTAMTDAVRAAEFLIERLVEPPPRPELRSIDAKSFDEISRSPRFLFFRLLPR